jgi:uncharacterized protein (DUF2062 family)
MLGTMLLSHAGDGAAETTWPWHDVDTQSCWRQCCQVMLVMALPRRLGHGVMQMLSHAGDKAAKSC